MRPLTLTQEQRRRAARIVDCPYCHVPAGAACESGEKHKTTTHSARLEKYGNLLRSGGPGGGGGGLSAADTTLGAGGGGGISASELDGNGYTSSGTGGSWPVVTFVRSPELPGMTVRGVSIAEAGKAEITVECAQCPQWYEDITSDADYGEVALDAIVEAAVAHYAKHLRDDHV